MLTRGLFAPSGAIGDTMASYKSSVPAAAGEGLLLGIIDGIPRGLKSTDALDLSFSSFTLGGVASFSGAVDFASTLSVDGAVILASTLSAGATSVSTLSSSGAATLNSLSVTNNASVGGTLGVSGLLSALAGVSVTGNVSATGDVSAVNVSASGNLTVDGNLVVNGDTVTVNTANLNVEDPLILLAKANAVDTIDIGFIGKYGAAGKYAGFFRDASDGVFKLFKDAESDLSAATTIDTAGAGYARADLHVGALNASGAVATGALTVTGAISATGNISGLEISGSNISASGTLSVTGASTLAALGVTTLSSSGAATLASLAVTAGATVGTTLSVTGDTTLAGLSAGATSVSTLSSSGAATLNSLSVTNNASVGGTFGVTGASTFAAISATSADFGGGFGSTGLSIAANGDLNSDGAGQFASLTSMGLVTANGALKIQESADPAIAANYGHVYVKDVGGVAELFFRDDANAGLQITNNGALNISGLTFSLQDAYVDGATITTSAGEGNLTVNGDQDFVIGGTVDLTFSSTGAINQTGNGQVSFNGNVDALNGLDVTGTMGVSGAVTLASTLSAGASTLGSLSVTGSSGLNSLTVSSTSVFTGAMTANGGITVSGDLGQSGGAFALAGNAASSLTTSAGALTITSAAAATWSTASGNLSLAAASGSNLNLQVQGGGAVVAAVFQAAAILSKGDVVYVNAAGKAAKSDADAQATGWSVGIAAAAAAADATVPVASIPGTVVVVNSDLSAATPGQVVYLSGTAGEVSTSAPSASGSVIFKMGYVVQAAAAGTAAIALQPQFIAVNP